MKNIVTLFVSPVQRIPSQGRDKQRYSFIDPFTKQLVESQLMHNTRAAGTEVRYMFEGIHSTGKYRTGLEDRIVNPFYDMEPDAIMNQYNLPLTWRPELEKVKNSKDIVKQTYYEILHGQEPGFYRSDYNADKTIFKYYPGKKTNKDDYSYIETFVLTLFDGPNRFTDETPRGAMAIQLIKNHSKIAPDKRSVNPVQHTYYVSEENEAEMEKMRKQDLIDEAIFAKINLQRNATDYKNYQVASLCTTIDFKPIVKGITTREQVKVAINNYLAEGKDQMRNVSRFMEVTDLLKNQETKGLFEVKYLVGQGFIQGVLSRRDGRTYWHSKSNDPSKYKWTSDENFISFILSEYNTYNPEDESQNWYMDLLKEVKAKGSWIE